MTPTLRRKLEALAERREELERLLADPDVVGDNERFRNFSREFAQLQPILALLAGTAEAEALDLCLVASRDVRALARATEATELTAAGGLGDHYWVVTAAGVSPPWGPPGGGSAAPR